MDATLLFVTVGAHPRRYIACRPSRK